MNQNTGIRWMAVSLFLGIVIIVGYFLYRLKDSDRQETIAVTPYVPQSPESYQTMSYDTLIYNTKGLSINQLKQHYDLYAGYVKKRNQIERNLQTVNRENAASTTYSPYRALKVAETFAVNGSLLHQLYFENMHANGSQPGVLTMKLIDCSFGSFDNFKKDFFDAGGVARGWVILAYGLDDGRLHNYVLEAHNQNVPVLAIPLLVLDVYEHAYMIDFGIKRANYLDVFWNNIDWNVVEERIEKWVLPFKNASPCLQK
jgi:Fe-Mn family superoxide dismutase